MSRKIVGITCSTLAKTEKAGPRQMLNRAYIQAVEQAGGAPMLLPITQDPDVISRCLGVLDGLLLSGGADLAPDRYGQAPHPRLGEVDMDRDAMELPLIVEALAQNMPIFAICRGIQSLNVALGGTLYQDLPTERPSNIHHQQSELKLPRDQFSHSIRIAPDSRLREIVGAEEILTNSFHHQAVRDLGQGLCVTAVAEDGVIEAAESPAHRYVLAVQFHPEETAPHDDRSHRLFAAFIAAL